jgi:hypothetical protein
MAGKYGAIPFSLAELTRVISRNLGERSNSSDFLNPRLA